MGTVDRVGAWVARVTGWVIVAMASVMMISLILQIVFRYLFNASLSWSEELALFLFTWVVLLAGSVGVREHMHVRLVLIRDRFPPFGRKCFDFMAESLTIGFGLLLVVKGWDYIATTAEQGMVSAAVRYPLEFLYLAAPLAGALIVFHGAINLMHLFFAKEAQA
ncbi:MAG: TRAP transporter small permease [Rhodospirillales bacterium]|jgi:TRAP-type C4-dicarboxylate transport system permease small subunit|nr:TRAP transporter small permease [Rhodospirillales bacterium]